MAVGRLAGLSRGLMDAGYPEDCPVAIIERATCPDQRTVRATLATVVESASQYGVRAPAIICVGEVVRYGGRYV